MLLRSLCIVALIAVCFGCSNNAPKNKFGDEEQVKIADLQDSRSTEGLIAYLYSDKIEYRRAAALALASVQDTLAIDTLGQLATPDLEARMNAAFALGQMYNNKSLKWLLYGELGDEPEVQYQVFEAMGKVVQKYDLDKFPSEFPPDPDLTVFDGVAWGIYRAGLRGITDSATINTAALILSSNEVNPDARTAAAHFFARTNLKVQGDLGMAIILGAQDEVIETSLPSTGALAKLKPEESLESLTARIDDPDYRVRVNAARALRMQPWDIAKPLFAELLQDSSAHVNVAAAETIITISKDTASLANWAASASNWRAQAALFEVLVKLAPAYSTEVQSLYKNSNNPYQKAALITALSQGDNTDFIFEQFKASNAKVITSTAASAIARINRRNPKDSPKFANIYKEIIKGGDQGAIIYACGAIGDPALGFNNIITDYAFLEEAKSKLSLPRDYETYVPLEEALNFLKSLPPPPPLKNEYNHPIDWKLAATINKDQKVVIETTKGKIVMQLFIEEAPGSVVNFVKLVNDKYYDGKYFHRVVPNFVIQTGCDRGDGFGSLDYSIRSEFSKRKYTTGSVGMASAGKDTEGVQWFITHSPTPHLDGKYTIFAEVIEGMDVVHKIEVGDQIISAHLAD